MIAKLITHRPDRDSALDLAVQALENFEIEELITNRVFLTKMLNHESVRAGDFDTKWVERFAKGKA